MWIVCQQTIHMKYQALFVLLKEATQFENFIYCKF